MDTVGQFLKAARIQSGRALGEIAGATKIRKGLLEAIEEDRYELLPPRIYLRGMIKLFAQEVGADVDAVLDTFEAVSFDKAGGEEKRDVRRHLQPASPRAYIPLVLIIVCAFLVYFFLTGKPGDREDSSRVTAPLENAASQAPTSVPAAATTTLNPAQAGDVKAAPAPAAASAPAVSPAPAATQPAGPFTIRFEAQALTWMRIQADQDKHFDILLRSGESYKHTATRTMTVRLGNAGGVTIYVDDKLLGTAGKPGEVINLQFPEAIQQLQQPR
jgi:cytoskeletal protein RodZ